MTNGFLEGGATFECDLSASSSDQIIFKGVFVMDSRTPFVIDLHLLDSVEPGQSFTLIDWSLGDPRDVTLSDFVLGESPVDGVLSIEGNSLRLTVVPEPEVLALLVFAAGIGGLASGLRRSFHRS